MMALVGAVWWSLRSQVSELKTEISKLRHKIVDMEINTDRGSAVRALLEDQHVTDQKIATLTGLVQALVDVRKIND